LSKLQDIAKAATVSLPFLFARMMLGQKEFKPAAIAGRCRESA
jgi:hypothetical protein